MNKLSRWWTGKYRNKKAPDPCVKVSLVPNKSALKFATRTLRSTTNPLFNESFIFPLTSGDLCSVHLKLKVCDRHDLSRYVGQSTSPGGGLRAAVSSSLASRLIPLGLALVNLSELDLMSIDETGATRRRVVWFQLKEPSQVPDVVKVSPIPTAILRGSETCESRTCLHRCASQLEAWFTHRDVNCVCVSFVDLSFNRVDFWRAFSRLTKWPPAKARCFYRLSTTPRTGVWRCTSSRCATCSRRPIWSRRRVRPLIAIDRSIHCHLHSINIHN